MSFDLPESWEWQPFEKLLEIPLRNGIYKKKEFHGSGAKIVNMGELFAYPRLKDVDMKRVELTEKELKVSSLESGDLIFARRSLTAEGAGKCTIVLEVNEPTTFESSIIRARLNKEMANPEFYYYLFNSKFGKWLLGTILRQVAVAGIAGSDLAKLHVPVPPLNTQNEIAKHGSLLDDKIELNRQINQTLEQIAQAIFKSWFVDFEPVKVKIAAKQNGQDPERAAMRAINGKTDDQLDALSEEQRQQLTTTTALFPDELEDSELGEIPKGWVISTIGEEVEVVGGGTPSTKKGEFWEGGEINWTSPKDLSGLQDKILSKTEKKITEAGLAKISSGLLPVDTVLMSSRAPVGYLAQAKIPVAINQGYIAMKCSRRLPAEFVLLWADSVMDEIKQRASGSTFAEISKKNFKPISVVVPGEQVVSKFMDQAKVIYDKISESVSESASLSEIRDSLLTRLLSGQIEV